MKLKTLHLTASTGLLCLAATVAAQSLPGSPESPRNTAILSSPRFLEEHPEWRIRPSRDESRARAAAQPSALVENAALAASPRFLEEHPELLRMPSSPAQLAQAPRDLTKLTENRALAISPRFLEEHPELSRRAPVFEVAPLK